MMENKNERLAAIILPLQSTLNCFRPEVARGDPLRTGAKNHSACSAILGGGDAFDQVLAFSDNKFFLSIGGRLAQQINLDDNHCRSPVLKADWVITPTSDAVKVKPAHKNDKTLCILQGRTLHLVSQKKFYKSVMLSHDYTTFWSLPCGLLLTSKIDITHAALFSSFYSPFNLNLVNFPSELSPFDIIWSSNNCMPSLSLLASYNATNSTISLWEVELSSMAQQDSDTPDVEKATPTQKRASLRHPNGGWSPLAFRPPPAVPRILRKEKPQSWNIKLLLEQTVPFHEGACEVNYLENADEQGSHQHSLCFTNAASGCQVIISLGGDCPPQLRSIKYEIASSAIVSPNFRPGPAADSKGVLELHKDGLLVFGSPSQLHQLYFRAALAQNGLPYLKLLDDGSDEVSKEVMMRDLAMVPVGMQHGSNRRVTLSFQGEDQPKARVSLDAVPLVSRELGSNVTEYFSKEEQWKLLLWSSLQSPAATGDAELEMDALLRLPARIPPKDFSVCKPLPCSQCQSKSGERFSWLGQGNVEFLGSKPVFDSLEQGSVISNLIQNAKLNSLARRHVVPLLLHCMGTNSCEETATRSPSTTGPKLQDKLLHFENLLAWQANSDGSSASDAQSIVRGIVENIFNEAKGIDPVATNFNPCNLRIGIDTLPAGVLSAVQYLARSQWTPYSKISLQLSSDVFFSESETSIMPGIENLDVDREEDTELKRSVVPYGYRLLRLPADSSINLLDGAADNFPAILEATCILDSSIPAALRGKAGRQGMISLQKTLAILASRQLALPLGRGALGLQTHRVLPTEQLCQPAISLAAEVTERNHAVINLDLSSAPPGEGLSELSAWPEFHAGVAEGLLLASSGPLTRTWVLYSKPGAPSYSYGGVLLGLGLAGHLGSLSATDTFRYLSLEHEPTLMGFLLGIAAAKRCSMDASTYKIMRLHYRAECSEVGMGSLCRIAATLGTGLLYQGSNHWSIIAVLLEQINNVKLSKQSQTTGRNDNSTEEEENVDLDGEMAVLAAGISIGLVVLGTGGHDSRYTALQLQLRHFIEGSVPGICDRQGRGQHIDTFVSDSTCALNILGLQPASVIENSNSIVPAATIALGLMYLRTNDVDAAAAFQLGIDDEICPPQHLTLKIMMRALILWDEIAPTEDWVWNCIPRNLAFPLSQIASGKENNSIVVQAHCFSVAGACLGLGIKFAGTKNTVAVDTLVRFVHYFLTEKCRFVSPGKDDEIIENCMAACALSLSVVLAGSGDLKIFKLFRSLLKRVPISQPSTTPDEVVANPPFVGYGSYSALSLALGFLFLSGGEQTFDTTQDAAAFLVIALFPHLPTATWDNRYYLQALRHFYVLATKKEQSVCKSRHHWHCLQHEALLCNPAIAGAADILL